MNADDYAFPSKSQRKRESEAAQKLGEQLIQLKPVELEAIDIPEELIQAIKDAHSISTRSAQKRHRQYIGKLMRAVDNEHIAGQLAKIRHAHDLNNARFKKLEQWRDRLLSGEHNALTEIIEVCPEIDRQHVNQLVRQAHKEQKENKPPAAARKLFRYLAELDGL